MMNFNLGPDGKTLDCVFEGRIDSNVTAEMESMLTKKMDELALNVSKDQLKVSFDLAKVDYIASAFIRVCLQTARSLGKGAFSVKNTSPFVMKIFVMTGLEKELNVS